MFLHNAFYMYFLLSYSISSIICFFIDIYIPHTRVKMVTSEKVKHDYIIMLPTVLTNLILAQPYFYYFYKYGIISDNYNNYYFIINLFLWLITTDVIFYSVHKLFHHKYLYFLHEKHHQFNYTYGIGAIYASIPDFYFANLFPVSAPYWIYSIPPDHCRIITILAVMYTVIISHGGYNISKGHLIHHLKYKYNYGLLLSDKILNTHTSSINY